MLPQVFSGLEGNSQEDTFRDTKHLITSVVDGFNVCMFAYGQTGTVDIHDQTPDIGIFVFYLFLPVV